MAFLQLISDYKRIIKENVKEAGFQFYISIILFGRSILKAEASAVVCLSVSVNMLLGLLIVVVIETIYLLCSAHYMTVVGFS